MSAVHIARWLLLAGLAFVFLYFGIDKLVHPLIWIGWIPAWMNGLMSFNADQWLQATGIAEIVIGAALLCPLRLIQRTAAFLAALHLTAVLTQTGWNDIAVRDIGLLMMAAGLWYLLKDDRVVK